MREKAWSAVSKFSTGSIVLVTWGLLISLNYIPEVKAEALQPGDPGLNVSFLLNNFQIGYDRRVRPNYGGIPVTVGVSLYILSIGDLSEKFMDFTFDMYFRQFWSDPRLSFDAQVNNKQRRINSLQLYDSGVWDREAGGGCRVHQAHLGARHILCQ